MNLNEIEPDESREQIADDTYSEYPDGSEETEEASGESEEMVEKFGEMEMEDNIGGMEDIEEENIYSASYNNLSVPMMYNKLVKGPIIYIYIYNSTLDIFTMIFLGTLYCASPLLL